MLGNKFEGATVHAVLPDGRRVLRHDLKWYIEDIVAGTVTHVTVGVAAQTAAEGSARFGVYGGQAFDAIVRRLLASRQENN